ncbi:ankyrin repeat-containing domain protein, partial [Sphaerosporella brunnea]
VRIDVSIRLRRGIYVDNLLIVKRILKNNPKSIFNPDIGGNTSLHLAAEWGRLDIVQYLVTQTAHEADGVSKNGMDYTPLMLAAREGHEDVVAFLAGKFEQCIDWRNRQGYTALMLAAMGGRDGVVNILLGQGADKEVSDILGNTALHYASAYVERGASVDHQNRQGWMPISYSCTFEAQRYFEQLVQD